jgi:hypothetical protein
MRLGAAALNDREIGSGSVQRRRGMATETVANSRLIVGRVAASLLGGYAFTWGFITLGIALLIAVGMPYDDAYSLTMMLAFLVFLGVFFWSFAAAGLTRIWSVLTGGGAVMTATAWVLSHFLLGHV